MSLIESSDTSVTISEVVIVNIRSSWNSSKWTSQTTVHIIISIVSQNPIRTSWTFGSLIGFLNSQSIGNLSTSLNLWLGVFGMRYPLNEIVSSSKSTIGRIYIGFFRLCVKSIGSTVKICFDDCQVRSFTTQTDNTSVSKRRSFNSDSICTGFTIIDLIHFSSIIIESSNCCGWRITRIDTSSFGII